MSGLQERRIFAALLDAGTVPHSDEQRVVTASGVLDIASIHGLQENLYSLVRAGHVRLIVDLSRVRLCDAAAMSGLLRVSRLCEGRGGWLRLAHPAGMVATAFRIVSLGLDVDIYPTVSAAVVGAEDDRVMR